jgi:hypothetical protein
VEPREVDLESAEDATSDDDCCNEVDAAEYCFIGKDRMKWGKAKSSTHVWQRGQNIVTKLPGVIGQARKANMQFEACTCLITDEILVHTVHHTNQNIRIIQLTFSCERDARLNVESQMLQVPNQILMIR